MSKNPFINAAVACLYIVIVSSVMIFGSRFAPEEDTVFAPMALISLFTLSAAVMGYIFCFEPLQLILSGKKSLGVKLFLQTVGVFAVITATLLFILFSGILG